VNETFTLGGTETSLVIAEAGPYLRVEGTGIQLQVLGQSLTGDFSFEKVASGGADHNLATTADNSTVIRIAASHVRLGRGSGTTDYGVVEDGHGSLLIASAGVAGQLQATVRVQNIDGVSFDEGWNNRTEAVVPSSGGDVSVIYIGLAELIRNKAASAREKDLDDLRFLRRICG
jgi:hypothetical protein